MDRSGKDVDNGQGRSYRCLLCVLPACFDKLHILDVGSLKRTQSLEVFSRYCKQNIKMIYKYCTCHLLFAELRRERDGFCCIEADSVGTWRFCKEPWSFWPFCQCVKWMRFFSTNDGPMDIWWSEVYGAAVAMPQIARSFWNSGVKFFLNFAGKDAGLDQGWKRKATKFLASS